MTARRVTPNPSRWVDAPRVYGLSTSDRYAVEGLVRSPGKPRHQSQSVRDQYDRLVRDGYAEQVGDWAWKPTTRAILATRESVASAADLLPGDILPGHDIVGTVWDHDTYFAVTVTSSNGVHHIRTFDAGSRVYLIGRADR